MERDPGFLPKRIRENMHFVIARETAGKLGNIPAVPSGTVKIVDRECYLQLFTVTCIALGVLLVRWLAVLRCE